MMCRTVDGLYYLFSFGWFFTSYWQTIDEQLIVLVTPFCLHFFIIIFAMVAIWFSFVCKNGDCKFWLGLFIRPIVVLKVVLEVKAIFPVAVRMLCWAMAVYKIHSWVVHICFMFNSFIYFMIISGLTGLAFKSGCKQIRMNGF